MPIDRLIPLRVAHEDEQPVGGIGAGGLDDPAAGGADRRACGHCNVDSRVRFCGVARAHLTPGHEPGNVERPLGRSGRAGLAASRRIGRRRPHGHGPHQIGVGGDGLLWGRLHAEERAELLVARLGTVQGAGELLHAAVLLSQPRHLSLQHGRARRRPPDRPRKREKKHDREPNSEGAPLPDVERPQREPIFVRLELPVGMNDDRDAAVLHPSKGDPSINSSRRARSSFE